MADLAASTLSPERSAAPGGYRTQEVAELIGLTPRRVRHFVDRGLIDPRRGQGGEYRFSFRDMVLLRTAKRLFDANVSSRRALAALAKVKASFGGMDDALSAMRIVADGNTVLVRDAGKLWEVETRQGRFPFSLQPLAGEVHELKPRPKQPAADRDADELIEERNSDDWYNVALDREEADPLLAPAAYRRALALNPKNADAHVNLGRLCQVQGDLKSAKRHYQLALKAKPEHQLAIYNLGTVFDELDEYGVALRYYRQAPSIPDAHYNQARIFDLLGDQVASARHMRRYRTLEEVGE